MQTKSFRATVSRFPIAALGSGAVAAALAAALLAAGPRPAPAQVVHLVVVDVASIAKGYRVSKLTGTAVQNDRDEKIGSLDDIVIGRDEPRAMFAVLQVGGFLGLGSRLVAVPYDSLKLDEESNGKVKIVLPGASKDELKKLNEVKYGT